MGKVAPVYISGCHVPGHKQREKERERSIRREKKTQEIA